MKRAVLFTFTLLYIAVGGASAGYITPDLDVYLETVAADELVSTLVMLEDQLAAALIRDWRPAGAADPGDTPPRVENLAAEEYVARGKRAFANGEYPEAIELAEQALAAQADHVGDEAAAAEAASVDELRECIISGNAGQYGAHANVFTRIPTDDHVRREGYLAEIESQWGPAPGKQQSDGTSIFVFGENLTDEDYQHRIGYPMPGRTIQVGIEVAVGR